MLKEVENAVTKGWPLRVSRRHNTRINVWVLAKAGYLKEEDVGDKILYRWADQFPVQIQWEGSDTFRVYNPNSVVHVKTKKEVGV